MTDITHFDRSDPAWPRRLLTEAVRVYSPSRNEGEIAELLVEAATAAGWNARVDEVGNFVADRGASGAARHLVFLGHIDTVTGEIDVREEDGVLYGRGSVDAKGPITAFLAGASLAALPDDLRVTVIGAVEEETNTSRGARHVVDQYAPDYLIIGEPSGWDSVCMGYKGNCHLRLTVSQPRTHGASGVESAGTLACRFWQAVEAQAALQSDGERVTERVTVDVRDIRSGVDGNNETASIVLDIRTPPGFDADVFHTAIADATPDGGSVEILEQLPPIRASKAGALVRQMRNAIRQEGGRGRFSFKTGTSDMNIAGPAWDCPMLAYGPGDSSLDHTPNEHIALDEFDRAVSVLRRALEGL